VVKFFYDESKIPEHFGTLDWVTIDGVSYSFEFSTAKKYKHISFSSPSETSALNEQRAVAAFAKFIYALLDLDKNFENLKSNLGKGKYRIRGFWIYKVLRKADSNSL